MTGSMPNIITNLGIGVHITQPADSTRGTIEVAIMSNTPIRKDHLLILENDVRDAVARALFVPDRVVMEG